MFNTALIGLFDRSLLPMSLIQVELALKQATYKSRTPVSMYQFDPIRIVYDKQKNQNRKWGSPSIQQK